MHVALLNLLYPQTCTGCGTPADTALCPTCRAAIQIHPAQVCCTTCGREFMRAESAGRVAAACPTCIQHPPHFDRARSAATFSGPVRDLIHAFKYTRATWLRRILTDLLAGCVITHYPNEHIHAICPVPLNRTKERRRGYNQAALLATALAGVVDRPLFPDVLARVRNTPTQTHMNAHQRRQNVRGAFVSPSHQRPWVYGRCILLIDDVMTTGATLSECAAALKANGAERVLTATVARD